jgi:Ca2+-binding RTX toxin-like protein
MSNRMKTSRTFLTLLRLGFLACCVLALPPGPAAGEGGFTCLGAAATIVGTPADDDLRGTPGADVIVALAGSDVVSGLGGNDRLCGGAGLDDLTGGAGADLLEGGANDDSLDGGPGNDVADYSASPVKVVVLLGSHAAIGPGQDSLFGFETVSGSRFADNLVGDTRSNTLRGGPGDDKLSGDAGADTLLGESGDDYMDGGAGFDTMHGGTGGNWCYHGERMRACRI